MQFLTLPSSKLHGTLYIAIFAIAAYTVSIPVRWMLNHLPGRYGKTISGPIGDTLQLTSVLVGAFIGAQVAGMDITVILAIVAIFTAGLSLAMDTSIKDAIACAKLLASRSYEVGEQITFAGITGKVEKISLFSTTINVSQKGLVTVGNSKIADEHPINHSREPVEFTVRIPIAQPHNRELVAGLIRSTAEGVAGIVINSVKVTHVWESVEVYTVHFKICDYDKRKEIVSLVSISITNELEAAKVDVGEMSYYHNVE